MLTTRVPDTWQDLQTSVARILSECGFAVALERVVDLGRGRAEIDVSAEEFIQGRRNLIICECKRWKTAIPQQVIHAFRTVTAETGANTGYIISLKGFQTGAFEAIERTNVRLVTWEEFQREFASTWLTIHFLPTVTRELDLLLKYMSPIALALLGAHPSVDPNACGGLVLKHWSLMMLVTMFNAGHPPFDRQPFPELPIRDWEHNKTQPGLPEEVLNATGYSELETILLKHGKAAIAELRPHCAHVLGHDSIS